MYSIEAGFVVAQVSLTFLGWGPLVIMVACYYGVVSE